MVLFVNYHQKWNSRGFAELANWVEDEPISTKGSLSLRVLDQESPPLADLTIFEIKILTLSLKADTSLVQRHLEKFKYNYLNCKVFTI